MPRPERRKFLVFGGGFDPVHRGHLALLRRAAARLRPGRVVLLPSGRPPHKQRPAAPFAARVEMLRMALASLPAGLRRRVVIDRSEGKGRGPHYTYLLLRKLARRHPGAQLWLLMGSDQFAELPAWKRPAEVRARSKVAAGGRPGAGRPRPPEAEPDLWLGGGFPDLSSTRLRGRIASGESAAADLPPGVWEVLRRRGLYGTGWICSLKKALKAGRIRHTLAVASLAGELARRHGLDEWKAQQAALLHDCGRALTPAAMVRYVRRRRLRVPALERTARENPMLLHAFVGADLARRRFGVGDREVLLAIERHTLGAPEMGSLERLLYVADAASEDRGFPGAGRLRALARRDLDSAFKAAVRMKLDWVGRQGAWKHPMGAALARSLGL